MTYGEMRETLLDEGRRQGLGPYKLSLISGKNLNSFRNWINDKVTPSADNFVIWANALGYDVKLVKRTSGLELPTRARIEKLFEAEK